MRCNYLANAKERGPIWVALSDVCISGGQRYHCIQLLPEAEYKKFLT